MNEDVQRELVTVLKELKLRREIDNKLIETMLHDCVHFKNRKNHSTVCYPPDEIGCPSYELCLNIEKLKEVMKNDNN